MIEWGLSLVKAIPWGGDIDGPGVMGHTRHSVVEFYAPTKFPV